MQARGFFIKRHPFLTKLLTSLVLFLVFLVFAELGFRVIRYLVKGPSFSPAVTFDADLGWHLNTNRDDSKKKNKCGETVVTARYIHRYLVKTARFTNDKRILFLGDSFTQAHEVSTGSAYYDVFEGLAREEYSVFAAGIGGFGSLQEYLLLGKIFEEVKPNIVIWQLHGNDVSNNVFALDSGSLYNNQRPRPYLDLKTGQVQFKDPGFFLFDVSHLFRSLFYRVLALDWTYQLGLLQTANSLIGPPEEDLAELREQGLDVLRTVVARAIHEHPDTRFFGFAADDEYDNEYKAIFEGEGAGYFAGVSRLVAKDFRTTDCLPLDDHWNHHGNVVAGALLKEMLDVAMVSNHETSSSPHPIVLEERSE